MSQLHIDDALVEQAARQITDARGEGPLTSPSAERLLEDQPELLAFLLAGTAQLGAEARAVGVFLGDVVFETFRQAGRETRAVPTVDFVTALRGNREMALRVGQAHDRFAERYLRNSRVLRQPALIRFITGVLLEPGGACPHDIPRDELGPLFIVLKSVIDVLDHDARIARDAGRPDASSDPR